MRKPRFTEEQIVAILKESEGCTSIQDLTRRHQPQQLEEENKRLKKIA